mmetsp:Transcript_3809/g.8731  ORF Transcript_3809/g.8731 Transcript_3809/m.8731 type:complete len:714 (+) Transcript_3809:141-2282(+)
MFLFMFLTIHLCYSDGVSHLLRGLAGLAQDVHGLGDLGVEGSLVLDEVEHLRLVHLEEHSGDLGGGGWLDGLDQRVEGFSDDDSLLVRGGLGQLGGEGGGALLRDLLLGASSKRDVVGAAGHGVDLLALVHPWVHAHASVAPAHLLPVPVPALLPLSSLHHWDEVLGQARSTRPHTRHHGWVHARLRGHAHLWREVDLVPGHGGAAGVHGHTRLETGWEPGPRGELSLEPGLPLLLALSEGHVQRLALDHLSVHLGDGAGRLLRGAEGHEAGASGGAGGVPHDLARDDGAKLVEELSQLGVVDSVAQVLEVEVGARELLGALLPLLVELGAELGLSLGLLLRPAHKEVLLLGDGVPVKLVDSLGSSVRVLVVDEAEALALAGLRVLHDGHGGGLADLLEELLQVLLAGLLGDVLHVDVAELAVLVGRAVAAAHEGRDVDDLVAKQLAVDLLDGLRRRLLGVELHEAEALGHAAAVAHDLRRGDVTELGEGVVQLLVVDGLVKVLDEDVADAALPLAWVALRVHDAHGLAVEGRVVQHLHSLPGVGGVGEVHVRVPERAPGDEITADPDAHDVAELVEELVELRLAHAWVQVSRVEGGPGELSLGISVASLRGRLRSGRLRLRRRVLLGLGHAAWVFFFFWCFSVFLVFSLRLFFLWERGALPFFFMTAPLRCWPAATEAAWRTNPAGRSIRDGSIRFFWKKGRGEPNTKRNLL